MITIILFIFSLSRVRHSSKIIFPKMVCFFKIDKEKDHPVTYKKFILKEVTGWLSTYLKEYIL